MGDSINIIIKLNVQYTKLKVQKKIRTFAKHPYII